MRKLISIALGLACSLASLRAEAILLDVPRSARAGELRPDEGHGAQLMFVRAAFGGFPLSLEDARALLEGRQFVPAFDAFCGLTPYVDFTNGTVSDSLGRQDPTVTCLPFIDPQRAMSASKCREIPGFPEGHYYQNGGASLRVAGLIAIREAGDYTMAWGHDDGFGMSVGDLTVFEFNAPTGSRVDYRELHFSAPGLYRYQLDWFDGGGGALIDWYIAPGLHDGERLADGGFALVSQRDLYPSGALPCTPNCAACTAAAPFCDFDQSRCLQCRTDADCADCEACEGGVCRTARDAPGAALPTRCRPPTDGGAPGDAGAERSDSAILAPAALPSDGCGCHTTPPRADIRSKIALMALALLLRRRASWRRR